MPISEGHSTRRRPGRIERELTRAEIGELLVWLQTNGLRIMVFGVGSMRLIHCCESWRTLSLG
jgi:hypothetical protein